MLTTFSRSLPRLVVASVLLVTGLAAATTTKAVHASTPTTVAMRKPWPCSAIYELMDETSADDPFFRWLSVQPCDASG